MVPFPGATLSGCGAVSWTTSGRDTGSETPGATLSGCHVRCGCWLRPTLKTRSFEGVLASREWRFASVWHHASPGKPCRHARPLRAERIPDRVPSAGILRPTYSVCPCPRIRKYEAVNASRTTTSYEIAFSTAPCSLRMLVKANF